MWQLAQLKTPLKLKAVLRPSSDQWNVTRSLLDEVSGYCFLIGRDTLHWQAPWTLVLFPLSLPRIQIWPLGNNQPASATIRTSHNLQTAEQVSGRGKGKAGHCLVTAPILLCPPLDFLQGAKSLLFASSPGVEFLMHGAKFNTNKCARLPEN